MVLCIQLKRFTLMGGKIGKPVQLSRALNIGKFVKRAAVEPTPSESAAALTYRLVSMITHVGPSVNCGHYTAIGEAGQNQFYQFDDASVRSVPAHQVLNTASYVVFYEMTRSAKQAWINGASATSTTTANGVAATNGVVRQQQNGPSSTVTSGSLLRHNNKQQQQQRPTLPPLVSNHQPRLITADGRAKSVNSLGVKVNGSGKKASLVPYQGDSSDSADEQLVQQQQPASSSNGHTARPASKPFIPRAITINAMKRNGEFSASSASRPETPLHHHSLPPSADRPPSVAESTGSNSSRSSVTKQLSCSGEMAEEMSGLIDPNRYC